MSMSFRALCMLISALALACGGTSGGNGNGSNDGGGIPSGDGSMSIDGGGGGGAPQFSELWYSVDDRLVYIPIDASDATVGTFVVSTITTELPLGQNMLTMLDDGSLVGGRLSTADDLTYFYHVAVPPRDGSPVTPTLLGVMPEELMLEGLYTDCDGRLYGMDTGTDNTNSDGNRLLRFTGDFLAGDFAYVVVSDLATADVADIDDMGPGIIDGNISDNPGLAIDTGEVHAFNYQTGSGEKVGSGGTFGIHALGRELFADDTARLYVFDDDANLYEMDPVTFATSSSLGTGPSDVSGPAGHSGLAGPLTNCNTGFVPIE